MLKSVASRFMRTRRAGLWLALFAMLWSCSGALLLAHPASAAQTVPYKINYQGRLTNASGAQLADGNYNMKFRLYSVATGGTATWTETRDASTQQVAVSGGQFAVQLGDVTALSPSMFTSQPLYLEVELPTPATATCNTVGCASWAEGPMTPRQALASSAYAMNADTVDGIDGANIATLDGSNHFTGATTNIDGDVYLNGGFFESMGNAEFDAQSYFYGDMYMYNTSPTALRVRDGANTTDLFVADTTNMVVKVGLPSSATATLGSTVKLLTTSAEFNGAVRIGNATDGVDISSTTGFVLNGAARHSKATVLIPEYANAVLDAGSGSNNTGTMTSKFDLTTRRNYYKWTTTSATAQSYDVVVQVPIPSDFSAWASTTPITVDTYTANTSTGPITLEARDTAGAVVTGMNFGSITPSAATTWQSVSAGAISGTYTPGGYMTLRLRMTSPTNGDTRIGNITLNYLTKW